MGEKFERKIGQSKVPLGFGYAYYVGKPLEKFYQGLSEKKIFAVKCQGCGKVIVPPRTICGECDMEMEEWVELSGEGTLENFTVAHVSVIKGEVKKLEEPQVLGMVKLDGADSLMDMPVQGLKPADLKPGIRLRAVWSEKLKGAATDISHFEPL